MWFRSHLVSLKAIANTPQRLPRQRCRVTRLPPIPASGWPSPLPLNHTSPGQRCRIPDICERLGGQNSWGCGGRPGLHWPTQTRSRSVRQWFGRAESVRGGGGVEFGFCTRCPPHENARALGVRWRTWGSASVGYNLLWALRTPSSQKPMHLTRKPLSLAYPSYLAHCENGR